MPVSNFLPADLTPNDVRACVALVSDTHMPRRCRAFPPALFDVLAGADLLIHAGDVGELWVLDRLSAIAPVVAVHGNDETDEATRHLPYETVIPVQGERVFVWHSHYRDWHEERAARQGEEILGKLDRTITRAQQAGASLAIFGHWHIPLVHRSQGVTVVNPGAIASGNEITRQLHQTVALAWLVSAEPTWRIVHVEVGPQPRLWDATVAWEAGFSAASARYQASIFEPGLAAQMPAILALTPPALLESLRDVVLGLAHRVWAGELPRLSLATLVDEAVAAQVLSAEEAARLLQAAVIDPSA